MITKNANSLKWILIILSFILLTYISTSFDIWFYELGITKEYQHQISLTIFGSGLIAFFVSLAILLFQKDLTDETIKITAITYFKNELLIDIQEVFQRDYLDWNLLGPHYWVYDNSFINSLYDTYVKNKESIWKYSIYMQNPLMKFFKDYYLEVRRAYVQSEKLDNIILKKVTIFENNLNLPNTGHNFYMFYVRAKLYLPDKTELIKIQIRPICNFNPESGIKYSEWIYDELITDKDIENQIRIVREIRKNLIEKVGQIKKEVHK